MHEHEQSSSLEAAMAAYRESLNSAEAAVSYLRDRGVDPFADATRLPGSTVADYYGLGYVDTPAVPGHDGYVGRLSISYRTQGGVRAMKFRAIPRYREAREGESPSLRALDDSEPKYLGIPGQKPRLYNVNDLLAATDVVAVCEGELDTVVASQVVGVPAVGVAGTAMWRDHLPRVFAGIPRVLVIADNDAKEDGRNPGRELGERIAGSLDQATVITPPSGDDLTDWLLRDGVDAVRKAMGL